MSHDMSHESGAHESGAEVIAQVRQCKPGCVLLVQLDELFKAWFKTDLCALFDSKRAVNVCIHNTLRTGC